jgi:hypothetical protein
MLYGKDKIMNYFTKLSFIVDLKKTKLKNNKKSKKCN